jgi:hypothetical protein
VTLDFDIAPIGSIRIAMPASWLEQMGNGMLETAKLFENDSTAQKH